MVGVGVEWVSDRGGISSLVVSLIYSLWRPLIGLLNVTGTLRFFGRWHSTHWRGPVAQGFRSVAFNSRKCHRCERVLS